MSSERIKPWNGWMSDGGAEGPRDRTLSVWSGEGYSSYAYPVIVTPLLPDDPKVGEVWEEGLGSRTRPVTITGAPFVNGIGEVVFPTDRGGLATKHLSRIPATKTYRLPGSDFTLTAESKEAAAAQIVDSLIEEEG